MNRFPETGSSPTARRAPSQPIRILIIDDHRMFAEAIELMLSDEDGIEVVGIAGTGEEGIELCRQRCPSVVLMDIDLPGIDGIEATRRIRAICPDARVLVVTALQERDLMVRTIDAGAVGFVPKWHAAGELTDAIRRAADGEIILPGRDVRPILTALQEQQRRRSGARERLGRLTSREVQILQLLANGTSTSGVADALHISPLTVQGHVKSVLTKLGAHSKLEAVSLALRHGLIQVGSAHFDSP
jgi:DNA-binding NarL/FixJ family response regulator